MKPANIADVPAMVREMFLRTPVPAVLVMSNAEESESHRTLEAACPLKSALIAFVTFDDPKADPMRVMLADPMVGTFAGAAAVTTGPMKMNSYALPTRSMPTAPAPMPWPSLRNTGEDTGRDHKGALHTTVVGLVTLAGGVEPSVDINCKAHIVFEVSASLQE